MERLRGRPHRRFMDVVKKEMQSMLQRGILGTGGDKGRWSAAAARKIRK